MEPRQVGPHSFQKHSASRPHMQVIPSTLLGNASGNLVKIRAIFRTQKDKHGPTASIPPSAPGFRLRSLLSVRNPVRLMLLRL